MLWYPSAGFLSYIDNFGSTYTTAGFGTAVSQSASAHTKGSDVDLLTNTAEDAFGIAVGICANNTSAATRNYLIDIKYRPTGGTYVTIIPNLVGLGHAATSGFTWYYFPLGIPAGSDIGAASQCNVGNGTANSIPRIAVRLFTKPNGLVKYGAYVEAFGADTANSRGSTITPGTSALGSYTASLGSLTRDLWWFQGGLCVTDTTMTESAMWLDIATGDATNKVVVAHHIRHNVSAGEHGGKDPFGIGLPIAQNQAGVNMYARAACSGTPDSTVTVVAYGLGG